PQGARPGLLTEAPTPAGAEDGAPLLDPRAADPVVLARAVRDLRERMADQEQTIESLREQVASQPTAPRQVHYRQPNVIHDVDSAVRELDLDGGQQAELERIVDYTKRRIEDLRLIPNAEGKTWVDVSRNRRRVAAGEAGDFALLVSNFAEINEFRNSTVPGTDETYGEAERRIRNEGKADVRRMLTPEQEKTWDDAHTDGLFGSQQAGIVSFAIATEAESEED
ncbi:MAG: hypothetical protein ACYTG6_06120, partial [Planctomycetota bacterium]